MKSFYWTPDARYWAKNCTASQCWKVDRVF